jgi:hypothetical protein
MPRYKFGLTEQDVPDEQPAQWQSGDVAAMQTAAGATADIGRNRDESAPEQLVLAFRVTE